MAQPVEEELFAGLKSDGVCLGGQSLCRRRQKISAFLCMASSAVPAMPRRHHNPQGPLSAATEKSSLIPRYCCRVVTCLVLSRTAFAYIPPPCSMCSGREMLVCPTKKRHKRAAQVVEIEGCTSVEPLRVRMRLGREHVMVCVEAHLQGLGVTCLFERERRKR